MRTNQSKNSTLSIESTLLKDLILAVLGALFIAIFAQIHIQLPYTPVPITGQTLAVLLLGGLYGARKSLMSTVLYLLFGSVGLPVFAMGAAGVAILGGATAGYIFSFIPAAYFVGFMADKFGRSSLTKNILFIALGSVIVFSFGIAWLSYFVGLKKAILLGVVPFIPGDILKIMIAATSLKLLSPISQKAQ